MSNLALILKMWGIASQPCSNYGPSNLLFCFSDYCICHLNKTQRKVAVMLTMPIFESYSKLKTLMKVSKNLTFHRKMAVL